MNLNGATLQILKECEKLGIPAMDCVIYHKGKEVFRYMSGYSDDAKTKKVDGSERYNLYSCSKLITCTAALQLVEKDIIRLEDPVYEYLPEFRNMKKLQDGKLQDVKNTMTLRHLFTMTAGLTYQRNTDNIRRGIAETGGRMQTREAMKYLACDPLAFEPGESWQYSLCHDVLAAVVEVASGKRFGVYLKENIFDPCGMDKTTFLLPDEELPQITAQYQYDNAAKKYNYCGPENQGFKFGSEYESGGAGCVSTVNDYISFMENLRKGNLFIKKETLARMASPQISKYAEKVMTSGFLADQKNYSYGLGVRCPKFMSPELDFGWGSAAGAYLAILPEQEITIFYVQHVLGSATQPLRVELRKSVLKDL